MTGHDFSSVYTDFVFRLAEICRTHFEEQSSPHHDKGYALLQEVVNDIEARLTSADAIDDIQACTEVTENYLLVNLEKEMKFFLKQTSGDLKEHDLAESADTGTTVKDSLSSLLTALPGWIKKLLDMLDELLDLVK